MLEERGRIVGDQVITEKYTLWGSITGDMRVQDGGKVYVRGNIHGDLIVEFGGRVHVYGHVSGNLRVDRGAKVIYSGTLGGDATNDGGRLFIEACATLLGKIKTKRGETVEEPKIKLPDDFM